MPCALPELPGGCVGGGERHPGKNKFSKISQVQIPAGSVTLGQWLPLSDPDPPVLREGAEIPDPLRSVCPQVAEGGPVSFHHSLTSMVWDLECGRRIGSSICPLSRLGLGYSVAVPTHTFLV